MSPIALTLSVALLAVAPSAPAHGPPGPSDPRPLSTDLLPGDALPGEAIVSLHPGHSLASVGASLGIPLERLRLLSGGALLISLPEGALPRLKAHPGVRIAQPNYKIFPFAAGERTPSDLYYDYQWHYPQIALPGAWDLTTGSEGVNIAVIDSGVVQHPDLVDKLLPGYDMVSSRLNADDGDGRDPDPTDTARIPLYHGTHVSGTVGASSNNDTGVSGVCWDCKLVPVRALGSMYGTTADSVDAIRWAAGLAVPDLPLNPHPADVINMSLGANLGEGAVCALDDLITQEAIDDAVAVGVVVVAAAGNSGLDAASFSPAGCEGVITVGSTARFDVMPNYSNFGDTIDVVAPGGGFTGFIWSTWELDLYMGLVGTSQASPHVAGVAGLMRSVNPGLSPAEVQDILMSTAKPLTSAQCRNGCGAGVINAYEAVRAAQAAR